jgi:hypothetical protein
MKINKKFNELSFNEYFPLIKNHKNYSDFNTLGFFRSLLENENLSIIEKIEIRDFSLKYFDRTFNFLQLKDPFTFLKVKTLGEELTKGDEQNMWKIIKENQQKILKEKKIRHRNFGTYSKHKCPYEDCVWNGVMVRQGSKMAGSNMHFKDDNHFHYSKKMKFERKNKNFDTE